MKIDFFESSNLLAICSTESTKFQKKLKNMASFRNTQDLSYPLSIGRTVSFDLPAPPRQNPFPAPGDLCHAQWRGRGRYYQVLAERKSSNNRVIVTYLDMNKQETIPAHQCRAPPPPFLLGDIIQIHDSSDGAPSTFDVLLDNGELLQQQSASTLKKPSEWRPAKPRPLQEFRSLPMWSELEIPGKKSHVSIPISSVISVLCEETTCKEQFDVPPTDIFVQLDPTKIMPGVTVAVAVTLETRATIVATHETASSSSSSDGSSDGSGGGSGSGGSGSGGSGSGGSSSLVVTIHLPNGDIVEEYPVHLLGRVQETKPGINKWGKRLPSKKIPPVEGEKVVFHDGTTWRSGTALGLAPPRGCTSNATKSTVLNNQVTFFQGDITTLNVDAIQNAANDKLWSGGGICGAIFAAANDFELSRECSKKHPSGCPIGKTALTSGCQLHAKHVLHTVGPRGEKPALLESAYVSALEEAAKAGCDSVALCCISTGIFGYPPECAAPLAISTVRKWLDQKQAEGVAEKDMRVVFCLFLDSDVELYQHWMTEWFPR